MTNIYFIRHAEPDFTVHDDFTRPLTEKGRADCAKVTAFLHDKNIHIVLSSPYIRAVDTVSDFAREKGLVIERINDFCERKISDIWIKGFNQFTAKQWADFQYKLPDGECLAEVQERNISALRDVLNRYKNKNIAVGSHGAAMSTIINYYDNTYGYADFSSMVMKMPWVVKMVFDGDICVVIEKTDL
jgi:2,3-bisphosphoglycerate-dependent phosphoglycerate mutase